MTHFVLQVYRDSESTPMVCCDACERWVHCDCDGIRFYSTSLFVIYLPCLFCSCLQ
jgi:hypothetical protein